MRNQFSITTVPPAGDHGRVSKGGAMGSFVTATVTPFLGSTYGGADDEESEKVGVVVGGVS